MKSLKKKFILIFTLCLTVLFGSFAGIFLGDKLKANSNDYELTIQKVNELFVKANEFEAGVKYYVENNGTYSPVEINRFEDGVNYYTRQLEVLQKIQDDNIFMLNNANIENYKKEFLLVKFEPKNNAQFLNLSVNATLKNASNNILNISTLEKTSTEAHIGYEQLFDLSNTYLLDTSKEDGLGDNLNEFDAQGHYKFVFTYNIKDSSGVVTTNLSADAEFYLLNERYYVNPNNIYDKRRDDQLNNNLDINYAYTEPRIFNTERIDRKHLDNTEIEENYFNFSNQTTLDYYGNQSTLGTLLYPTLKFDASRYYVEWTKSIYGTTLTYRTKLDTTNYPKLLVTETNSFGTITNTFELNDVVEYISTGSIEFKQYIATIEFDEVGTYSLKYHYVLNGEVLSNSATLAIEDEHTNIVGDCSLTIFGYQLEHSEYKNETGATEKEMKNCTYVEYQNNEEFETYNVYEYDNANKIYFSSLDLQKVATKTYYKRQYTLADVTNNNLNGNKILGQTINAKAENIDYTLTNNSFSQDELSENLGINVPTLASSNQAPIFFKYYAEIKNNSTNNNFYYHFTKSGNTYTLDGSKKSLNSNTRFIENGLYVAVLTYSYPNYGYWNGAEKVQFDNGESIAKVQVFVFEIANVEPRINITAENTDLLSVNGFTNKTVTIDWSEAKNRPFDVTPVIKVFYSATYDEDMKNHTDVTNTFDGEKYANGTIEAMNSGRYYVRVDYGPCTYAKNTATGAYEYLYSASMTYTFVIDKDPINDIKFINPNTLQEISADNIINNNFAVVFGDTTINKSENGNTLSIDGKGTKTSGAKITLTYDFMPINAETQENVQSPLDAGEKYIANNKTITQLNEDITYNQEAITPNLKIAENPNILTNDGIYTFHFEDEAGNKITKYLIKDTTSPLLLQKVNGKTDYSIVPTISANVDNIMNTDVEIVFGSHKAIKIDSDAKNVVSELLENENLKNTIYQKEYFLRNFEEITDKSTFDKNNVYELKNGAYELTEDGTYLAEKTYFKAIYTKVDTNALPFDENYFEKIDGLFVKTNDIEYNKNYYLLVEINTQYEQSKNNLYDQKTVLSKDFNKIAVYYINERGFAESTLATKRKTSYTVYAQKIVDNVLVNATENEHNFYMYLSDKLGNKTTGKFEISFDNSSLKATVSGLPNQNRQIIQKNGSTVSQGEGVAATLDKGTVSNKKLLSVSWIQGEGEFEVESVVAYFYPITFEIFDNNGKINKNYPYSSIAYQSFNLMENTSTETLNGITRIKSADINLVQNSRFGEPATVEGMYQIVRKYVGAPAENVATDDDKVRLYYYYIDRNNIISYNENFTTSNEYIGNYIQMIVGDELNKYVFAGKQFLQEFVNEYILKSNKLPVTLSIPTCVVDGLTYTYKYYVPQGNLSNEDYADLLKNSKIGINTLNYKIYDYDGNEVDKINSSVSYSIEIYDNADLSSFIDSTTKFYNSLTFNYLVDLKQPEAKLINDSNVELTGTINSHISTNNTNIKLVWNKIGQNDLDAKIDESKIAINIIYENEPNIKQSLISGDSSSYVHFDENTCYLNFNDFSDKITRNCRVEITLVYQTLNPTNYGDYYSTTKTIYFDFSKPNHNYNRLIANDKLLDLLQDISNFEDYNAEINFENYAFTVNADWKLENAPVNSFWQYNLNNATYNPNDIQSVWYRVYDKKYSNESGANAQSIVPGDDRYGDKNKAPTRYMFNADLKIDGELVYKTSASGIAGLNFSNFGGKYIEIIEMDCAGNYRVYTIYIPESSSGTIECEQYSTAAVTNSNEERIKVKNYFNITEQQKTFEVDNEYLAINSIANIGEWLKIEVLNGVGNQRIGNEILVSPVEMDGYVNKDAAIDQVNQLIYNDSYLGRYFVIKITSPLYGVITIHYHTPGQEYEIDFTLRSSTLVVTIDQNKYNKVTYLKTLQVFEIDNKLNSTRLTQDDTYLTIKNEYTAEDGKLVYTFVYSSQRVRHLQFVYFDNFGQKYTKVQLLGVTQTPFETMLTFDGIYEQNAQFNQQYFTTQSEETGIIQNYKLYKTAEYFTTANTVSLEYQPEIFGAFVILRNGELVNLSTRTLSQRNTEQFDNIFDANDELIGDTIYQIFFKDTSEQYYLFVIHHYTKLSEIHFIDSGNFEHIFEKYDENGEINLDYESSVSRIVHLQFEEYDNEIDYTIKTTVSVSRTYYDSNNVRLTRNYGNVSNLFNFNEYGIYTVTARNSLGTTKTFTFEYIKSDAIYYSVKANANGKTIELSPSPIKYPYSVGGQYSVDHYLSIYEMTVDVNQEKNLRLEELTAGDEFATTRIYHIFANSNSASTYDKYIAVTKVETASDIIGTGNFKINDELININSRYYRTKDKTVTLTIPKYFADECNVLKTDVYYGTQNLNITNNYSDGEELTLTFTTAGVYYIYVSDIAGNRHSFGGTPYFTLSVINDFVYNLNGERGIFNSIYNNAVELTVSEVDSFVRDTNGNRFTITSTLNGEEYKPTLSNGKYVFTSYGTYFVTLKGYVGEISDENLVTTVLKFTILNNNEAKFMHEYIGLNGYEITKIIKDGADVTNQIRELLNSATLNKFAIYGGPDGVGGNGHYTITVTAVIDKIIGEREFTYSVWINKDTDVLILCNIPEGDSTTGKINIQLNLYQIYQKLGECKVKVNGNDFVTINAETATQNEASTYNLPSANQRYNVTLETNSGNTIMSFVVTKVEPLSTLSIVVIVVVTIVVAGLVTTFIILRKKMRVR